MYRNKANLTDIAVTAKTERDWPSGKMPHVIHTHRLFEELQKEEEYVTIDPDNPTLNSHNYQGRATMRLVDKQEIIIKTLKKISAGNSHNKPIFTRFITEHLQRKKNTISIELDDDGNVTRSIILIKYKGDVVWLACNSKIPAENYLLTNSRSGWSQKTKMPNAPLINKILSKLIKEKESKFTEHIYITEFPETMYAQKYKKYLDEVNAAIAEIPEDIIANAKKIQAQVQPGIIRPGIATSMSAKIANKFNSKKRDRLGLECLICCEEIYDNEQSLHIEAEDNMGGSTFTLHIQCGKHLYTALNKLWKGDAV